MEKKSYDLSPEDSFRKLKLKEKGYINEEILRNISCRSCKNQIQMTKEFNIAKYPCAVGGCLLADKQFASKLRGLFQHKKKVTGQRGKHIKNWKAL